MTYIDDFLDDLFYGGSTYMTDETTGITNDPADQKYVEDSE